MLEDSVFAPEDSLALALDLLVLPLSLLDVLALLDEVTWLLLGVLSAELDSLWLEQAVSKAIEERVTIESTIAWENLFFIIISSFLVYRKSKDRTYVTREHWVLSTFKGIIFSTLLLYHFLM